MIGKLIDVVRLMGGKWRVTYEVDAVDEIRGMENKEVTLEVKQVGRKRSLSANAYFHVLVGKIADKLNVSKPRCKNILLGRYGQRWIEADRPVIISVRSDIDMLEFENPHCIPVGHGQVQGKDFTHYAVIRGSHEYNTVEMSHLIDGTVQEAKELGIETLPATVLERMMKAWNQSYRAKESAGSAEP